jgi:hypothetical protein
MKIALIGSAPSSVALAPYKDESWTIWGCSPGAIGFVSRANAWFEIHAWEPEQPWFSPGYREWMAKLNCPVYMLEPRPEIPTSMAFPFATMREEFGDFFFTSSLSWMLALAICQNGVEEIGLWGVDMAAHEEYAGQRPGCHFFIREARLRGIKVTVPPESDLLRPPPLYGLVESTEMFRKLTVRKRELEGRLAACNQVHENNVRECMFLKGAIEQLDYQMKTWMSA